MSAAPLEIANAGLVTSVGLSAASACAAIRAGLTNPTPTRFQSPEGEFIMAHSVPLARPWRGREKLARMAAMAIEECLAELPREEWQHVPLLLCVAEQARPGRTEGLDDVLIEEIQDLLDVRFAPQSVVIAHGRVSASVAMLHASRLVHEHQVPAVLIAGTDSLLTWPTLRVLSEQSRLLAEQNSNGFMAGEAAGAVLTRKPTDAAQLICAGVGFATERAHIDSEEPLRADGLTQAIKNGLAAAGLELHQLDFRIGDMSGEQYYFKEAALALGRILRQRKETFDLWHPAECIGETGAAAGLACLAVALMASRKKYAPGRGVLLHASADGGQRAAMIAVAS